MTPQELHLNWGLMLPELILVGTILAILGYEAWKVGTTGADRKREIIGIGLVGTVLSMLAAAQLWGPRHTGFGDLFQVDRFAVFFKLVCLTGTGLTLMLSERWLRNARMSAGGFISLILTATTGMLLMLSSTEFIMLFLGLEIMSIPVYALASSRRWHSPSVEAGMKYLVLGSFSTAILLFGVSLIYGFIGLTTGKPSLDFIALHEALAAAESLPHWLLGGTLLVFSGIAFKVSAVPFHMWTPDSYEGAPTPVTGYMSVAMKTAALGVALRLFGAPEVLGELDLTPMLWWLAAMTMIVGNVLALTQSNLKRMLAYSSIAHSGYALLGLLAGTEAGVSAVAFYALSYTFTNLAAFGVLIALSGKHGEVVDLKDLRGVGRSHPFLAAVLSLSMLSLMGIPPLAGFFGKFYVFAAAVQSGYIGLAILGVLTSAVSVAYYLRPMVAMYMEAGEGQPNDREFGLVTAAIAVAGGLVVAIGLLPAGIIEAAGASARLF